MTNFNTAVRPLLPNQSLAILFIQNKLLSIVLLNTQQAEAL